jgi:DNA-nicking Smr family endonuclease
LIKYQTYGVMPELTFLTKHGVTQEEAKDILNRHLSRERQEAYYRACVRAIEEAKDVAYARMTILEKLVYRWRWMVKHYG